MCDQCEMAETAGGAVDCANCPASGEASGPTLEETVQALQRARRLVAEQDATVKSVWEQIEQTRIGQRYKQEAELLLQFRDVVDRAEAKVRELALQAYTQTGSKKPAPGIGIRVNTSHSYSIAEMYVWCEANAPTFIVHSVDAKAIGKVAKGLQKRGAPIVIEEQASATIATDLDKALGER